MNPRRTMALVVVAAAAVGGTVADRAGHPAPPAPRGPVNAVPMPTGAPGDAVSSTWYCTGGPAAPGAASDAYAVIANPTKADQTVVVTVLPQAGNGGGVAAKAVSTKVKAMSTVSVRYSDVLKSNVAAGAVVSVPGGSVVASQVLKSSEGFIPAPCASTASTSWTAPSGSTGAVSSLVLTLLNPFPDDAIADLSFATGDGRKIPNGTQGIAVPARSLVVVDVGEQVRRQDAVSSFVTTRRGRLVVGRNSKRGNATSMALAAPAPATAWFFSSGDKVAGRSDTLILANPGDRDADVTVEVALASGDGAVEPVDVPVPAHDRAEVKLDDDKIPKDARFSVAVRSADDAGIVVERSLDAGKGGHADALGATTSSRSWLAAVASGKGTDRLQIQNVGDQKTTIKVLVLDGSGRLLPGAEAADIESGSVRDLSVSPAGGVLLVQSEQPVLVQRTSIDAAGPYTVGFAVPLT